MNHGERKNNVTKLKSDVVACKQYLDFTDIKMN